MAEPKQVPGKKVFDVSKPSSVKAEATSKPVIVGHKPLIGDPMVTDKLPISALSQTDIHDPKDTGEPEPVASEETEATAPKAKTANSRLKPSVDLISKVENEKKGIVEDKKPLKSSQVLNESNSEDSENLDGSGAVDAVLGDAKGVKEAELIDKERNEAAEQLAASGKYKVQISGSAKHKHHHHRGKGKKGSLGSTLKVLLLLIILLAAGGYAAVDSGFVKSNIKLPYHFFKQKTAETTAPPVTTATNTKSASSTPVTPTTKTASTIPDNFQQYKMVDAGISFAYPKDWGNVLVSPEKGYTKRDSAPKSDGVFAYIATFAKKSDVELVVTSNKYLPVKRTPPVYYDYLKWCATSSGSFRNEILNYKTVGGVDQPDGVTCDQILSGTIAKLDDKTLKQANVKNGSVTIGDIYSRNLETTSDQVVLHIKDSSMINSDNIKTLLLNVTQLGTSAN